MKFQVEVTQTVEVELDETKFNEAFLSEFRESFYPFTTIGEHVEHLAQLYARGYEFDTFVEGYGEISEFGIIRKVISQEQEIIRPVLPSHYG